MENEFVSLSGLKRMIDFAIENAKLNKQDINKIPVIVKENYHRYPLHSSAIGYTGKKFECYLEYFKSDEIIEVAEDKRPENGGEFWRSRGASPYDVSGYVVSKPAGERILRFVKYVLENDNPKTFLDFREREPLYIQFKFSAEEFDCDKLDTLARANNDIITEEIIKQCVLKKM